MRLKSWNELPESMKNKEVEKYYEILDKKKGQLMIKRLFDIVMSFILCVLLSPVFLIIGLWIKIDSKGSVFYRQERVTQYNKTFRIYKFRTMVSDADKIGSLVTTQNDGRITKVGKKIRKCRLDEIPQLFNVLKGEMSFVGTRPEVRKYVEAYTDEMKATLLLPAGITSLASINFRNEDEIVSQFMNDNTTIDDIYIKKILPQKMKYNYLYLNKVGVFSDLRICIRTVM